MSVNKCDKMFVNVMEQKLKDLSTLKQHGFLMKIILWAWTVLSNKLWMNTSVLCESKSSEQHVMLIVVQLTKVTL